MDPVYTGPTLSRSRACCRPSGRVLACRRGRAPAEHNAQSQLSQSGLPCYPNTNAVQILHLQQCCRPLLAASRRTAKDLCGSGWFPRPAAWASDGFRARCAPTPAAHAPAAPGAVPCPHLHQRAVRSSSPTALAGPAGWHRAAAPAVLHATAGDEPTGPRLVPLRHCGPPSWWGAILGVGAGRCGPPRIGSQPVRHLGLP